MTWMGSVVMDGMVDRPEAAGMPPTTSTAAVSAPLNCSDPARAARRSLLDPVPMDRHASALGVPTLTPTCELA
jgi:hypothetical protein